MLPWRYCRPRTPPELREGHSSLRSLQSPSCRWHLRRTPSQTTTAGGSPHRQTPPAPQGQKHRNHRAPLAGHPCPPTKSPAARKSRPGSPHQSRPAPPSEHPYPLRGQPLGLLLRPWPATSHRIRPAPLAKRPCPSTKFPAARKSRPGSPHQSCPVPPEVSLCPSLLVLQLAPPWAPPPHRNFARQNRLAPLTVPPSRNRVAPGRIPPAHPR
mmetsp:Transcript_33442/g.93882  ORF Transcript_33442/g.93882 Transcript_33442/m.93882 type:complete len:212 (+) Transcript_33442:439-1074(+)